MDLFEKDMKAVLLCNTITDWQYQKQMNIIRYFSQKTTSVRESGE